MNRFFKAIFAIILLFAITSCNKNNDPINPDPGSNSHPVLWSFDISFGGLSNITPAIDENDNIYFSAVRSEDGSVVVFCLDKNGNQRWQASVPGNETDKVTYSNGEVFVVTGDPVAIYAIDASSGNTLWNRDLTEEYDFSWIPLVAVNNNKVYLASGQFFYGYLLAFDFEGNELWTVQGPFDGSSFALNVSGQSLYFYDDIYLYRYDDNGSQCDSIWAYRLPSSGKRSTNGTQNLFPEVVIGSNGNLFLRDDMSILVLSPQGDLIQNIDLGESFEQSISKIILTANDDIIIGNGNLVKISASGTKEWESDINDGLLINPYFANAPVLASNGNLYDAQLFGLYSVKSDGKLNWKVNAENGGSEEYGNLHTPVLTHDGNIISVSIEQSKVRCFKGDGKGLENGGWPKIYGDYGNTCSR